MNRLIQKQFLPVSLKEAWDFFATPANLNAVTPEKLVFEITSAPPEKMYSGLIITYRLRPMFNLPINWVTEIKHVDEYSYFVDEQRKGPYRFWHHEHHFSEVEGGVLMTDILHYDIGKWVFGWLAGHLFVHSKVKEIFAYRYKTVEEQFRK